MDTMTTMQHLGHAARRARRASWHRVAPASLGCGTTGVGATPMFGFMVDPGNTTVTTEPAGGTWSNQTAIEHHARHLGTRST